MRHLVSGRKLGRTTEHRWALFRNQASSLIDKGRIETTLPKAKELRPIVEGLITLGKENNLASRRRAFRLVRSHRLVNKLFVDLAPQFRARLGGYTRILKLGCRLGDAAPMAIIEFVNYSIRPNEAPVDKKKRSKSGPTKKDLEKEKKKK